MSTTNNLSIHSSDSKSIDSFLHKASPVCNLLTLQFLDKKRCLDESTHLLHRMDFKVSAGFPSPAEDLLRDKISLDKLILNNPISSFVVQAQGTSMIGAGILDKSYLVVDRSLEPKDKDIVIVSINNEHTVKRLKKTPDGKIWLCPENPDYPIIELKEEIDNILWGVVIAIINRLRS